MAVDGMALCVYVTRVRVACRYFVAAQCDSGSVKIEKFVFSYQDIMSLERAIFVFAFYLESHRMSVSFR